MSEASRIVDELRRAIDGDPWHGHSIAQHLDGLGAEHAGARPVASAHTIWEIVCHMTAWTNEVRRRLSGHPASEPEAGDWPKPSGGDDESWRRDRQALDDAHHKLVAAIAAMSDAALLEPTHDPRNRETGHGVSRYVLLHGLAQHHAYHGGQIGILKRVIEGS
jgi:uncharacterized damage-inducible protein DinB